MSDKNVINDEVNNAPQEERDPGSALTAAFLIAMMVVIVILTIFMLHYKSKVTKLEGELAVLTEMVIEAESSAAKATEESAVSESTVASDASAPAETASPGSGAKTDNGGKAAEKETESVKPSAPGSDVLVEWKDPALGSMVGKILGKKAAEVTEADILGISKLYIIGDTATEKSEETGQLITVAAAENRRGKVSDLSDLNRFKNLTELSVIMNDITDIGDISELKGLKCLNLDNNYISDLKPLESLTGLEILSLGKNSISDITSISYLSNIKSLYLAENEISNLNALTALKKIEALNLSYDPVTDVSPLASCVTLRELHLDHCPVKNYSPLKKLNRLDLGSCSGFSF